MSLFSKFYRHNSGAYVVLGAIVLPLCLLLASFVTTIASLAFNKITDQAAADIALLSGASEYYEILEQTGDYELAAAAALKTASNFFGQNRKNSSSDLANPEFSMQQNGQLNISLTQKYDVYFGKPKSKQMAYDYTIEGSTSASLSTAGLNVTANRVLNAWKRGDDITPLLQNVVIRSYYTDKDTGETDIETILTAESVHLFDGSNCKKKINFFGFIDDENKKKRCYFRKHKYIDVSFENVDVDGQSISFILADMHTSDDPRENSRTIDINVYNKHGEEITSFDLNAYGEVTDMTNAKIKVTAQPLDDDKNPVVSNDIKDANGRGGLLFLEISSNTSEEIGAVKFSSGHTSFMLSEIHSSGDVVTEKPKLIQ